MQKFAQYHLNRSSKYEAGTMDELLKGATLTKTLFITPPVQSSVVCHIAALATLQ